MGGNVVHPPQMSTEGGLDGSRLLRWDSRAPVLQESGGVIRSLSRALAILALGALASSAQGAELFRRGDVSVELSGSIRGIGILTRGTGYEDYQAAVQGSLMRPGCESGLLDPDFVRGLVGSAVDPVCFLAESFEECPAFHEVGRLRVWQSLMRVRTRLDVEMSPSLSGRIEYDHELVAGRLDTLEAQEFGGLESDPLLPFQEELWNFDLGADSRGVWRHALYRGWLRWESERARVILGRQRIPWGVGRLWNPIDRFNPIPPLAIEQSESTGIDAVVATWFADDAVARAPADPACTPLAPEELEAIADLPRALGLKVEVYC